MRLSPTPDEGQRSVPARGMPAQSPRRFPKLRIWHSASLLHFPCRAHSSAVGAEGHRNHRELLAAPEARATHSSGRPAAVFLVRRSVCYDWTPLESIEGD
ncbi:hypothetical protein WOLCODRAFT_28977 [Wolfiporia cocos MD-104 SS10]|uniref:Uncharacterized protein n=1 Tax=Wolfiporia cocos (strain MD-104) TaxID=742152 RepID=A0A2H3JHK4_WOLCO|nr:hypothetical protein WOLCODRAFT_28977 [Wolfiporia cocos MD-104 SS10]